jgi:myo-inositol-1(or 4)-monophosphatase
MYRKNLSKHTLFAIEIAEKSSSILKDGFNKHYKIFSKEGIHNLVTEYDLKSEDFIISSIKNTYPNSSILSEEKGKVDGQEEMRWIIDPLDGTVNFAHHIPFFCVNIALEINSVIASSVTLNPITNELFVAEKDKGAYLNGIKLQVSEIKDLKNSILATGFPYNLIDNPKNCIERFVDFLKIGIPNRRTGSAAIDLAYLAAGRFDGYYETNLSPWDCAGGFLMIKEAGGEVTGWKGEPWDLRDNNTIVASNSKIHEQLIEILKKS